ncbi:hypothetical protein LCGC14_0632730 [marine sediment metagenome]|uniref:Uncharacterized protein n=1 Tax=marine sediment metagenome TaxID=412755 RepID=A0A0F9UA04_9ZZZZ
MENKKKIAMVTCDNCHETFTGLTIKQAERYKQMHKCKGDQSE